MTSIDLRRRTTAVTKLALATREKLEPQTLTVYLEALSVWATDTLEEACRRLMTRSAWFPKVAEIVEACETVAAERRLRMEQRQLADHPTPIDPQKWAEFKERVKERIALMGM